MKRYITVVFVVFVISASDAQEPEQHNRLPDGSLPTVNTVVSPGQPHTVTVSLQAFTNLHDVHFFVPDRSLASFVAISPAHIRHLKKHAVLPVTITFSMPAETAAPPSSALQGVIAASADDDDRRRYDH